MSRIITVEICDDGKCFISEENSSGASYDAQDPADVGFAVECYLEDYT
jgi:hypothetical protein